MRYCVETCCSEIAPWRKRITPCWKRRCVWFWANLSPRVMSLCPMAAVKWASPIDSLFQAARVTSQNRESLAHTACHLGVYPFGVKTGDMGRMRTDLVCEGRLREASHTSLQQGKANSSLLTSWESTGRALMAFEVPVRKYMTPHQEAMLPYRWCWY